mmetsp:Transcript_41835/g.130204  ORF Transcript_41835/g.130204 Transcript_41835/m.130204 type:complete len:508 (+) Transcript_41835:329-1852(+)
MRESHLLGLFGEDVVDPIAHSDVEGGVCQIVNCLLLLEGGWQDEEYVQDARRDRVALSVCQHVVEELAEDVGDEGLLLLVPQAVDGRDQPREEALAQRLPGLVEVRDHLQVLPGALPTHVGHRVADTLLAPGHHRADLQEEAEQWPYEHPQDHAAQLHHGPRERVAAAPKPDHGGSLLCCLVLCLIRCVAHLSPTGDLNHQDERRREEEHSVNEHQEEGHEGVDVRAGVRHEQKLQHEESKETGGQALTLEPICQLVLAVVEGVVHVVERPEDAREAEVHDELRARVVEHLGVGDEVQAQYVPLLHHNIPPIYVRLQTVVKVAVVPEHELLLQMLLALAELDEERQDEADGPNAEADQPDSGHRNLLLLKDRQPHVVEPALLHHLRLHPVGGPVNGNENRVHLDQAEKLPGDHVPNAVQSHNVKWECVDEHHADIRAAEQAKDGVLVCQALAWDGVLSLRVRPREVRGHPQGPVLRRIIHGRRRLAGTRHRGAPRRVQAEALEAHAL